MAITAWCWNINPNICPTKKNSLVGKYISTKGSIWVPVNVYMTMENQHFFIGNSTIDQRVTKLK